jgi:hypothetical protein
MEGSEGMFQRRMSLILVQVITMIVMCSLHMSGSMLPRGDNRSACGIFTEGVA